MTAPMTVSHLGVTLSLEGEFRVNGFRNRRSFVLTTELTMDFVVCVKAIAAREYGEIQLTSLGPSLIRPPAKDPNWAYVSAVWPDGEEDRLCVAMAWFVHQAHSLREFVEGAIVSGVMKT